MSITGPHAARRIARASGLLVGLALLVLATSCVGSGKTARTGTLEPFPDGMRVVSDTTAGCREGESGFDYRFIVVGPANIRPGGALSEHILSRGFYDGGLYLDDLPWVTAGYQHRDYPIHVEVGTLDRYIDRFAPHTGPPIESLPKDVRDNASSYVLLALRPTDFACNTPL